MTPMEQKVAAAQATLDAWKGREFAWGSADCAKMVREHLARLGHKVAIGKAGPYKSALGARRALARAGHKGMVEAMDAAGFLRIPPAAVVAGDVMASPSDDPIGTLVVALGNGAAIGWIEDVAGASVIRPSEWVAAWSVSARAAPSR